MNRLTMNIKKHGTLKMPQRSFLCAYHKQDRWCLSKITKFVNNRVNIRFGTSKDRDTAVVSRDWLGHENTIRLEKTPKYSHI